jgi:hypothetical protein
MIDSVALLLVGVGSKKASVRLNAEAGQTQMMKARANGLSPRKRIVRDI